MSIGIECLEVCTRWYHILNLVHSFRRENVVIGRLTEVSRTRTRVISLPPTRYRTILYEIVVEGVKIALGIQSLADSIQTMQLVEDIQLDDILIITARNVLRSVWKGLSLR